MAQVKAGRAMLLQVGDGQETPTYTTIASLTSKSLTISNDPIESTSPSVTDPAGVLWMESLPGKRSLSLTADGRYKDEAAARLLQSIAYEVDPVENFRIIVPDVVMYSGRFRLESLDWSGGSETELTFSISLNSTGPVTARTPLPRIPLPLEDHSFPNDQAITAQVLPEAAGGSGSITYSVTGLPDGLSFTPATRTIAGTPADDQVGDHYCVYTATDTGGAADRADFRITVT